MEPYDTPVFENLATNNMSIDVTQTLSGFLPRQIFAKTIPYGMLVMNVDIPKTWILNSILHIDFACILMVR